jgi:hypothetical protein
MSSRSAERWFLTIFCANYELRAAARRLSGYVSSKDGKLECADDECTGAHRG